ncbi:STAS/SEC14 domain-containing protein [Christiangramia salexigens]|uniref:STAS/SEC14 domain-containing protein n=1 Tax=Christiangramia salexigens TaxID=1913577 RepID=A0A1L3J7B0_9FLAO|nr:STAS/SEC14 domain-containing protein [Christiangramia salexigens]APG61026.1 hypothetical protein LPB144_11685 [Christiangramia salexigens]
MISKFELASHVIGILVSEDITSKNIDEIHLLIREGLSEQKQINLFVKIKSDCKISAAALLKDLEFKIQYASKFNKMAIVTEIKWFRKLMSVKELFVDADIRTFKHAERLDAMNWISE